MAQVTKPIASDATAKRLLDTLTQMVPVVPMGWGEIDDKRLPALMSEVDAGDIDLTNDLGWESGDERVVKLTNDEEITLILTDPDHYTLATPTASGRTTCNFTIVVKQCLNTTHKMNLSGTNAGSWHSSDMRTYLNNDVINLLPNGLKSILKEFNVVTATEYNVSTLKTSVDKLALFAEKEVQGAITYSNTTEANALTQLDYFKTASNKIKTVNGSASTWWLRSPASDNMTNFCNVTADGSAGNHTARITYGVSFFGCI